MNPSSPENVNRSEGSEASLQKEITQLKRRLDDREKAWKQFEIERSELDCWKALAKCSNEQLLRGEYNESRDLGESAIAKNCAEITRLSSLLAVAKEALEKIDAEIPIGKCSECDCWPCRMWKIAHAALASMTSTEMKL